MYWFTQEISLMPAQNVTRYSYIRVSCIHMNYSTLAKSHMPAQNVIRGINKSIKLKRISAQKYVLQNSGLPLSSGQFPGDQKVHYCKGRLYRPICFHLLVSFVCISKIHGILQTNLSFCKYAAALQC